MKLLNIVYLFSCGVKTPTHKLDQLLIVHASYGQFDSTSNKTEAHEYPPYQEISIVILLVISLFERPSSGSQKRERRKKETFSSWSVR
jgi:hypothetical protein